MLLTGLGERDGFDNLKYKRTGPFAPPMVLVESCDIVVTNEVKVKLEQSDLKGLSFKKVDKVHIVDFEWHTWNLTQEHPPVYPIGNDPYNYILGFPHSRDASEKMGMLWEVKLEVNGKFIDSYTYEPGNKDVDIMNTYNSGWVLVNEKAKRWISENCGQYLEFNDLDDLFL